MIRCLVIAVVEKIVGGDQVTNIAAFRPEFCELDSSSCRPTSSLGTYVGRDSLENSIFISLMKEVK